MGVGNPMDDSSSSSSSSSGTDWKSKLRAGGAALNRSGSDTLDSVRQEASADASKMDSYRKGGKVRKTGVARLHKGEYVVPRSKVKQVRKAMRKMKGRKSGR